MLIFFNYRSKIKISTSGLSIFSKGLIIMKKGILLITLFVCCLAVVSTEYQNDSKKLIITGSRSMPPMFFEDKNNNPAGVMVDFWTLWGEHTGYTIEFRLKDWNDSLEMVKNGEADIHAGLFYSEARDKYLDYSEDIYPLSSVLFIQKDINIKSINDLAYKKIAVIKGSFEEEFVRKNYRDINLVLFDNNEDMVKYTFRDNLHGFISGFPFGMYFVQKYGGIDRYKIFKKMYTHQLKGAVKDGNADLLQDINKGLAIIPEGDKILVYQKWLRSEEVLPCWFVPFLIIGGFVLLSVIHFVYIYLLRVQVKRKTIELEKS